MNRHRIAKGLALTSPLLAVATLLFLSSWPPSYQGEEISANAEVVRKTSASLIEENGAGVLAWLFFPALLSAIRFLGSLARFSLDAARSATTLMQRQWRIRHSMG